MPGGSADPKLIGTSFNNDNSPCVLPSGAIVSLWMQRPGGSSVHELKVMAPDGSSYFMIGSLLDVDIQDIGIGCGA